jgi:hypothetical protein
MVHPQDHAGRLGDHHRQRPLIYAAFKTNGVDLFVER